MNKVIEAIKNRRTTRKFTDQPVEREKLDQIIEAGIWAPSGTNMQGWHFTVVQDKDLMNRLSEATKEAVANSKIDYIRNLGKNKDFHAFYNAPVVVIISSQPDATTPVMDVSAATQNMLLAAESLELGTCWNGIIGLLFKYMPDHEVVKELKLPEGVVPSHAVAIGHKAHVGKAPERREGVVQFL